MISRIYSWLRNNSKSDWIALGAGLVTYAGLTLNHITASAIWFDEAFGVYMTRFNFLDIARYTAADVHPPFYYWILKIWTDLFGRSDLAFRSMSVLFGMVAIVFGFLLVKRLFGRKAALVSLLLLVLSPMLTRYGQEARMYTLVAAICVAATYVLTFAVRSKRRTPWIIYGLLVTLGMWTYYFTILVWFAHWVWRYVTIRQSGKRGKELWRKLLSGNWLMAYIIAVAVFVPWGIIALLSRGIFGAGNWVGAVGAYTFPNYLTNVLFYQENHKVIGWYAAVLCVVVAAISIMAYRLYKSLNKLSKQDFLLLLSLAVVPVVLLFMISLPPLRSSFVERYLLPSIVGFSLVAGVALALGIKNMSKSWRIILISVTAGCMVFGISSVYYYGNYNKNTNINVQTKAVVEYVQNNSTEGEPIISSSPWTFYEAVPYNTARNPVYFLDSSTNYEYGSLDMLKYSDDFKIKDLKKFVEDHPRVWYIGYSPEVPLTSPDNSWHEIRTFTAVDEIDHSDKYKATEYQTN